MKSLKAVVTYRLQIYSTEIVMKHQTVKYKDFIEDTILKRGGEELVFLFYFLPGWDSLIPREPENNSSFSFLLTSARF